MTARNATTKHKAPAAPAPGRRAAAPPTKMVRARAEDARPADISTPAGRLNEGDLQWLVGYQLAQASIVTIAAFDDVAGIPHGLRTVEYTLLALVHGNPGVSPAQLAKALGLSAPYITTGLDKLARRGLIVREANESDRRGQHLHVTKPGEALVVDLTARLLESERAAFKTLSAAEQMMLAELLHKLARSRHASGRVSGAET